jgi:hypothetical protein
MTVPSWRPMTAHVRQTSENRMKKLAISVMAVIVCYGASCLMTSCLGQTTLQAEHVSPTGKYTAELSEGDTGAVGGWMSSIRISQVSPTLWSRLLGRERLTVFGGDFRSTGVTFEWTNDIHLHIMCNVCDAAKIEVQRTSWRDVTISYELSGLNGSGK